LGLLVDADHHRLVWRIQVQVDDVADLLYKERVTGELEMLLPVGPHQEGLQPAVNRGLGDPCLRSQRPSIPVGAAIGWLGLHGHQQKVPGREAPPPKRIRASGMDLR